MSEQKAAKHNSSNLRAEISHIATKNERDMRDLCSQGTILAAVGFKPMPPKTLVP